MNMIMIIKNDLKQKTNFDFYYRKYNPAINKYARELSSEIGKPDDFEDYKQMGAISLFNLYQERLELINFEPEIYKYKDILKDLKKKGLIIDFNVGVRNPYKNTPDFLLLATKWVRSVLRNDMRDYRRRSCSYDEKTVPSNDIYHKPSIRYLASNSLNLYKSGNIFNRFEDKIIQRIDVMRIIKEFKSQNVKKISIYWINGLNGVQISNILNISKQAVYKNIDHIKKQLHLYYFNDVI